MPVISRKTEDYLEAILNISLEKGYARTKDIAEELSIQPPSVVEMIQKLSQAGFVIYRKYEGVTLTEKGRRIAETVKDRHETLRSFLELVRIPETIATQDACKMEHELSPETIEQIRLFSAFLKESPKAITIITDFEGFLRARKKEQPFLKTPV